jgi:hypothetical protein
VGSIFDEHWKDALEDGGVNWKWLPEQAVDPLAGGESWSRKHGDGGGNVRQEDGGDDGLDGADLGESVVRCVVVLQRRLDVVEEEVDWRKVANTLELEKDAKNCRPISGLVIVIVGYIILYVQ